MSLNNCLKEWIGLTNSPITTARLQKGREDMHRLEQLARDLGPEARAMLEKALAHHHV
jgi:hypothetical protein